MDIKVASTNGSKDNTNYVRVYVDAIKVGEVSPTRRNPLGYMRQYRKSKYWAQLLDQVMATGRPRHEVFQIMGVVRGTWGEDI
jgi:hypothetical protein